MEKNILENIDIERKKISMKMNEMDIERPIFERKIKSLKGNEYFALEGKHEILGNTTEKLRIRFGIDLRDIKYFKVGHGKRVLTLFNSYLDGVIEGAENLRKIVNTHAETIFEEAE